MLSEQGCLHWAHWWLKFILSCMKPSCTDLKVYHCPIARLTSFKMSDADPFSSWKIPQNRALSVILAKDISEQPICVFWTLLQFRSHLLRGLLMWKRVLTSTLWCRASRSALSWSYVLYSSLLLSPPWICFLSSCCLLRISSGSTNKLSLKIHWTAHLHLS